MTPERLAEIEAQWSQRYGTDTITEHGTVVRELCAALRDSWRKGAETCVAYGNQGIEMYGLRKRLDRRRCALDA